MRREVYSRPDGAVIRASGRRADGGETAQPAERRQSGQRGRVREEGGEGPSCDKTISAEQSSTGQTQFLGSWGNPLGRGDPGGPRLPQGDKHALAPQPVQSHFRRRPPRRSTLFLYPRLSHFFPLPAAETRSRGKNQRKKRCLPVFRGDSRSFCPF